MPANNIDTNHSQFNESVEFEKIARNAKQISRDYDLYFLDIEHDNKHLFYLISPYLEGSHI